MMPYFKVSGSRVAAFGSNASGSWHQPSEKVGCRLGTAASMQLCIGCEICKCTEPTRTTTADRPVRRISHRPLVFAEAKP